jgi:hypothetical protein
MLGGWTVGSWDILVILTFQTFDSFLHARSLSRSPVCSLSRSLSLLSLSLSLPPSQPPSRLAGAGVRMNWMEAMEQAQTKMINFLSPGR